MRSQMKKIFLIAALTLGAFSAQAKLFKNSYVSFELPPNWNCKQEGFEHICINNFSKKQKEAIIILTAKKRGPQDSLQGYEAHLKKARNMTNYKNVPYVSKVKAVRKRKISGVDWIDALQLGSEVQTYYTRYAATVKDSLGILVSFSAHKDHYSKYSSDFIKAIQSLKVIAPKELSELDGKYKYRQKDSNLFDSAIGDSFPDGIYADLNGEMGDGGRGSGILGALGPKGLIGILLLLIVGLGGFIYMKSR